MFGRQIPIHVIDYEGAPAYGVVEYGVATLLNGEIIDAHTRLCRAYAPIDPHDVAVHGISYEESLRHAPFDDDYDFFVDLRRRGPLAAHNAHYEARLTRQAWAFPPLVPAFHQFHLHDFPRQLHSSHSAEGSELHAQVQLNLNWDPALASLPQVAPPIAPVASWGPWIDSCALARKLAPGLSRYKLQVVVEELGLANELNALALDKCPEGRQMYHAALYDAIASALILKKFIEDHNGEIAPERLFSVKG